MTEHYCQNNQDALREGLSQMPDFTDDEGTTNTPTEEERVVEILNQIRHPDEGIVDCLKRIIEQSAKLAG